jgi:hypothetical protein
MLRQAKLGNLAGGLYTTDEDASLTIGDLELSFSHPLDPGRWGADGCSGSCPFSPLTSILKSSKSMAASLSMSAVRTSTWCKRLPVSPIYSDK